MIRILVSGHELELAEDVQIALTYQMSDLDNPSTEKNSFSKSIEVAGTPTNNDIFGHVWKLDRTNNNIQFDPRKRVNAVIYDNNDLIEAGYIKMNTIKVDGATITYEITFYGGVGGFFYNLMYNDNGDELTLADLYYKLKDSNGDTYPQTTVMKKDEDGNPVYDEDGKVIYITGEDEALLATWTKDYIVESWEQLGIPPNDLDHVVPTLGEYTDDGKIHSYLTACPTYSGLYDDIDNDKVLINHNGIHATDVDKYYPASIDEYTTKNMWALEETPRELSEWEVGCINSSQQRPCVKLSWLLNAICDPVNNGGYTVVWDDAIYDETTALGKYYKYAYVLFDRFDFEESQGMYQTALALPSTTLTRASASATTTFKESGTEEVITTFDTSDWQSASVSVTLQPQINIKKSVFGGTKYPDNIYDTFYDADNGEYHATYIAFRLKVYDGDELYSTSPVYVSYANPSSERTNKYAISQGYRNLIAQDFDGATADNVNFIKDEIKASATSMLNGEEYVIYAYGSGPTIQVSVPQSDSVKIVLESKLERLSSIEYSSSYTYYGKVYYYDYAYKMDNWGRTVDVYDGIMVGLNSDFTNAVFASNVAPTLQDCYVNKTVLFGNTDTPYDYLTSFTKLMGMKYYYDSSENTVHIMTRNNYFKNSIVNLDAQIDRSQTIEITPCLTEYKWYKWGVETPETYAQYLYNLKNKGDYGAFNYDTGYYFNKETNEIFEDNIYQNLVPYRLSSIYFNFIRENETTIVPKPAMSKTFTYTLWSGDETLEQVRYGYNGYYKVDKDKDNAPKLCCFDKDDSSVDCKNALVLFDGLNNNVSAYINDNMQIMYDLNENPCFIYGSTIFGDMEGYSSVDATEKEVVARNWYLPKFSKYHTNSNGIYEISLDFTKPNQTFIDDATIYPNGITIYDHFWKDYINDIYDKDGKIVSLYAIIQEEPKEAMRRFYAFDNCLWLLNKIEDYKPRVQKPLKCEFIKIMSVKDFTDKVVDASNYTKVIPRMDDSTYTPNPKACPTEGDLVVKDKTTIRHTQSDYEVSASTTSIDILWSEDLIITYANGKTETISNINSGSETVTFEANTSYEEVTRSGTVDIDGTTVEWSVTQEGRTEPNEILYTTTDGKKIAINSTAKFYDADSNELTVLSNTYQDGIGTITLSGNLDKTDQPLTNDYTLKTVILPRGMTSIGDFIFYQCASLTSVNIPSTVTSIGGYAFDECSSLTSITIPNSVTSIVDFAFNACYALTSITIPSSVTSIRNSVFSNCWSFTSITIPSSVTSIGANAFSGCYGLTSVTIPNSVTTIGDSAFSACEGLTSITIPSGVTSIKKYTFAQCYYLKSIDIPSGVTSIGDYTFFDCRSLADIEFQGTIAQWNAITKDTYWHIYVPSTTVVTCTDGTVALD